MINSANMHTAIHESGHAIVAALLGKQIDRVHMVPKQGTMGEMYATWPIGCYPKRGKRGETFAAICCAGFWAEWCIMGYCNGGAGSDFRKAIRATKSKLTSWGQMGPPGIFVAPQPGWHLQASKVPRGIFTPCMKRGSAEAARLTREHHIEIESLAESLLIHRDLQGEHLQFALSAAIQRGAVYDNWNDASGKRHILIMALAEYRTSQQDGSYEAKRLAVEKTGIHTINVRFLQTQERQAV